MYVPFVKYMDRTVHPQKQPHPSVLELTGFGLTQIQLAKNVTRKVYTQHIFMNDDQQEGQKGSIFLKFLPIEKV